MTETVKMVNLSDEVLTPREARLERSAMILRWGAFANGAVVVLLLVLSLFGGLKILPNLFATLQNALLGRVTLDPDAALAVVILAVLVNISLLLVLMVGVLARELWAVAALWIVVALNALALIVMGFTPALVTIIAAVWSGIYFARDINAFRVNPVMLKELRGRMRGVRSFIVLTVYLGLMSAFTALLYLIFTTSTVGATGSSAVGSIGRAFSRISRYRTAADYLYRARFYRRSDYRRTRTPDL